MERLPKDESAANAMAAAQQGKQILPRNLVRPRPAILSPKVGQEARARGKRP